MSKPNKTPVDAPNFLKQIIEKDLETGKVKGEVVTRFPPEPNGYLHLGHAKSICLNFGLAQEYQGRCHLRFDDTNPETEETEYVESIQEDVKWLGFDWGEHLYYASDYFEQIYQWAEQLIKDGKAYVDSQNEEEVRKNRGDFTTPGKDSPFRNRSVEENLDLFRRMRAGEFEEGQHILRAKIDMQSPNMNMRDPLLYRIRKAHHHRTGDKWCIYPMYDYAHPLSDAMEHITHSICTLEFQDHRPFYDWCVQNVPVPAEPHQYEFARMNMTYLVMSKRKLLQLVKEKLVSGWDDPRMPTISGVRRRGYTPESIRRFAKRIGVAKSESIIEYDILESCVRDHLDETAHRAMAVLDPIKVVIENLPDGHKEFIETSVHPKNTELGNRSLPFTKEVYIDAADFMENPPDDYFRLSPGKEVRLRNAYVIKCKDVIKDAAGKIVELRCEYDPVTLGGKPTADGRKVKGIVHWVSATDCVDAEVRVYERLFKVADPENVPEGQDFKVNLNPNSLKVIKNAKLEKGLKDAKLENRYQFERVGYFCLDSKDSKPGALVFNRVVELASSH
ncbi:glutamine--tRNA ligase/YqeY domain fusion protein [Bdellovibrio bacteriovorus]|uniref:Glutamine--tRNA ligase n=1 Tax=Bdellovibrio bacteriovorus TaxID=959 RepID=A0A1Z3N9S1_BDEBC|nr:glutamine--tRNA ligase/YqeY domain fusion protein [Bdellovibrio bacteriovorus]ASD64220.1 glutamine--tRNA ligase [Bdellovibrio bacteriovorus]